MRKILIIGACGQIGTELVLKLREMFGNESVIASDIHDECPEVIAAGPYQKMDILNRQSVQSFVINNEVREVYLLAALLSAKGEKKPKLAWQLNMEGLFTILDLAKEGFLKKVFWPSSIAVFGATTPRDGAPQRAIMEPSTVYGISKQAGERWCEYYHEMYGVDVRSIRYPGLISHTGLPGGGTTDYAVEIFYEAKRTGRYSCFLKEGTMLPMMFMEDAIRATIELMETPAEKITIRSSYNLGGMSFTPGQIAREIRKHLNEFEIQYVPDFRQHIADSWPNSVNDECARKDWGWKERYDLEKLVKVMLENVHLTIREKKNQSLL